MNKQNSLKIIIPVYVSFYVMGFVDMVGLATGYVKDDFQLSESLAQLLPFMVFLWFALLSIPTGILQDRKGKKLTVNAGMLITAVGLLVPFVNLGAHQRHPCDILSTEKLKQITSENPQPPKKR